MKSLCVVGGVALYLSTLAWAGPDLVSPMYRVTVPTPQPAMLKAALANEGFAMDCDAKVTGDALEFIVNESELGQLIQMGLAPQVIQQGRPLRETLALQAGQAGVPDVPGGYSDYATLIADMNAFAAANPTIAKVVNITTLTGSPITHEGRQIWGMKISDNVNADEDEPQNLIVSCHHAREIVTPVIAMTAIENLLAGYGSNTAITNIVNSNETWIVPVWNPDGYEYVFNVNDLWRKNRRNNGNGEFGVDLNRNYSTGWSTTCAGSTNPGSDTYKGPAPNSEPETQTMTNFSQQRRWARVMDYHSFGREVLYAYACPASPFDSFYQSEATSLSNASGYAGSNRPPSADGEEYEYQLQNFGAYAFLTETHTEFQPAFASAEAEADQLWPAILQFSQRPISVRGHVTDASTGQPISAAVSLVGVNFSNGEVNSSGTQFGTYNWTLPAGNYTLKFTKAGYFDATQNISVTQSSAVMLNVQMQPIVLGLTFSFPNGQPAMVDPAGGTNVRVHVNPGNGKIPQAGTGMLHVNIGSGYVAYPMTQISSNVYDGVFPSVPCESNVSYFFTALDTVGGSWADPIGAPGAGVYSSPGISGTIIAFNDNFQTNTGWTAQNLGATSGNWDRGVPVNDPNWAYDPTSDFDGSGACLLTQNAAGNTDVDGGAVQITSPPVDMTSGGTVSYAYYLNMTDPQATDYLRLEANSNNGAGAWTQVANHTTDGGLSWRTYSITGAQLQAAGLSLTSTMRFRFIANDGNPQSIVEAGVDAFKVEGVICNAACYADCDGNGSLDFFDFLCFQNEFGAGSAYADCDGSGSLDFFDFLCFQNEFSAGCP